MYISPSSSSHAHHPVPFPFIGVQRFGLYPHQVHSWISFIDRSHDQNQESPLISLMMRLEYLSPCLMARRRALGDVNIFRRVKQMRATKLYCSEEQAKLRRGPDGGRKLDASSLHDRLCHARDGSILWIMVGRLEGCGVAAGARRRGAMALTSSHLRCATWTFIKSWPALLGTDL